MHNSPNRLVCIFRDSFQLSFGLHNCRTVVCLIGVGTAIRCTRLTRVKSVLEDQSLIDRGIASPSQGSEANFILGFLVRDVKRNTPLS